MVLREVRQYPQLVNPSGLLDSRMMSLSPLRMKISLSQHETDTMSPPLSNAPIITFKQSKRRKSMRSLRTVHVTNALTALERKKAPQAERYNADKGRWANLFKTVEDIDAVFVPAEDPTVPEETLEQSELSVSRPVRPDWTRMWKQLKLRNLSPERDSK